MGQKIHEVLAERFAKHVRLERERRGWTTRVLAAKVGISAPYVSLLETQARHPTLEMIEKFAKAFDRDPAMMLRPLLKREMES